MNITSPKYYNNLNGNQAGIKAIINGTEMYVPLDPDNADYAEIQKQVAAGTITIEEAD